MQSSRCAFSLLHTQHGYKQMRVNNGLRELRLSDGVRTLGLAADALALAFATAGAADSALGEIEAIEISLALDYESEAHT